MSAKGAALGDRIKAAMLSASLTKSTLAKRVGVKWQTVHDWIQGTSRPNADNLRSIAEATNVTLEEILGVAVGQDPPFASWLAFLATPEGQTATQDERRALQVIAWPPGREPTVSSYLMALASVRSARQRV